MPVGQSSDEGLQSLRRALRDIAALSALPSLWLKADEAQIADSLAECLVRVLNLDRVRVVLNGRTVTDRDARQSEFDPAARMTRPLVVGARAPSEVLPFSGGVPETAVAIGLTTDSKLFASAAREDFPTEAERLALTMAANQAAVALDRVKAERALREESHALNRERDAVAALNRALANERDRLRHMFEQAPGFIALLRGPQHVFEFCNRSYLRLVGREDLRGLQIREALPEVAGQGYFELLDRAFASGEPYIASAAPVDLRGADSATLKRHYVDFIYQPVFDDGGEVLGILVEGHDVTDRVLAANHRQLLINELNHRVKNTLATVQSLAHQTLRDARTLADAKATLTSRLVSLSRTHDVLTRENWAGAEIGEIVDQAMTTLVGAGQKRVLTSGPKLILGPRAALALSMALHELGTNALKYGALSNDDGVVSIGWSEGDCDHAQLEWRERRGPPIEAPPVRKGFGSRLLESGLAVELGAAAHVEYAGDGLICSMRLPLAEPSPAVLLERA